jgi:hypothetical protein
MGRGDGMRWADLTSGGREEASHMMPSRFRGVAMFLTGVVAVATGMGAFASTPGVDVRLSNDAPGLSGYISADDLAGLGPYSDATLKECSRSRGRQNEPALAIDPRDTRVMVGSSNDYCGVYNDGVDADGAPIASGPIWLGYYRSENSGASFVSSLVPGYPGDTSTLGQAAAIRTASAGDPVVAWDGEGRLFMGAESSGDPALTKKSFGDVWVAHYVNSGRGRGTLDDGKLFAGTVLVARGSSAPNLLGKLNDKTAIEADRTSSACSGNVYFSWSRFTSNGNVAIYFSRSTDHGVTFSTPMKVSAGVHVVQNPDIAITSNGHVYVTFRQFGFSVQPDAIDVVRSTDCGRTFSPPAVLTTFEPMDLIDVDVSGGFARDCGDSADACRSGYTFFRADTGPRSTADQADTVNEWVHVLYEAIVPGTKVSTDTTFGWTGVSGEGGQSAIYYLRLDGATGAVTMPELVDPEPVGQQLFPDLAVDGGVIHALWWDSRNDILNDASTFKLRPVGNGPVGNDHSGQVGPALDVFAATRSADAGTWSPAVRLSDVMSNPNFEQFSGRTVPFAGDYLWIDSKGGVTFGVWTDWRDTVSGVDQRETTADETGADVKQCRTERSDMSFTGDTCPRDGGLDQNIYGDLAP